MRILVVRHARAFEHDFDKWPDDRGRPLTEGGKREFARSARQWRSELPTPTALWSSPLARAWQTAEILHKEAKWPVPTACPALEPGARAEDVIDLLARESVDTFIAVVGHEPDLSMLVSELATGTAPHAIVALRKGGLAELRCDGAVVAGAATLLRLIRPD